MIGAAVRCSPQRSTRTVHDQPPRVSRSTSSANGGQRHTTWRTSRSRSIRSGPARFHFRIIPCRRRSAQRQSSRPASDRQAHSANCSGRRQRSPAPTHQQAVTSTSGSADQQLVQLHATLRRSPQVHRPGRTHAFRQRPAALRRRCSVHCSARPRPSGAGRHGLAFVAGVADHRARPMPARVRHHAL